jgi:hypothetical protein
MASWRVLVEAEPEFAEQVRVAFDRHRHKTIATLRHDGSPRISGIEADFVGDDLWFGGMADSRKVLDLLRDPRFALHSGSDDPPAWTGDAKVAGIAEHVTDPDQIATLVGATGEGPGAASYFRADLREVVLTRLGEPADHLVIESWHQGRGLQRIERR